MGLGIMYDLGNMGISELGEWKYFKSFCSKTIDVGGLVMGRAECS